MIREVLLAISTYFFLTNTKYIVQTNHPKWGKIRHQIYLPAMLLATNFTRSKNRGSPSY